MRPVGFITFVSALLLVSALTSPTAAQSFDGFQEGTSDGANTKLRIKLTGGTPGDFFEIVWEQPHGTVRRVLTGQGAQYDANGNFEFSWQFPLGAMVGVADRLRLVERGMTVDSCDGNWTGGIATLVRIPDACPADLDGSGAVDFGDILAVLAAWGNVGGPEELDESGFVDFGDVLVVLGAWGPCE